MRWPLVWALLCSAAQARAEASDSAGTPALHSIELSAGGHAGFSLGDVCQRPASDVVGCSGGFGLLGLHLAPRWRAAEAWSFGAFGAVSWGRIDDEQGLNVWLVEGEARYHPLGTSAIDPSLGLGAGLVAIETSVPAGELGPAADEVATAPALSLRFAVDFRLARGLLLGPELRAFGFLFSGSVEEVSRVPRYGHQLGVALALNLTLLLDPPP
jgi:hypothetical protein